MLKKLREPVNGLTHFFAALAALVGLIILILFTYREIPKLITMIIYGSSLIALLGASAAYHLIPASPGWITILRKFDHSAIFLLIAGTYTPVCFNMLTGFWKWGLLSIMWSVAVVGIGFALLYIKAPRWLTASIYVVMGWLGVLGARQIYLAFPTSGLAWLVAGGLFFTVGAIIYSTKALNFKPGIFGFHEVWHLFVIAGCFCHFMMVLLYIAPSTGV